MIAKNLNIYKPDYMLVVPAVALALHKNVLKNAEKNQTRGLKAIDVVKVILKADSLKKPKLSYTVGGDAFLASLVSKLPQSWINNIIKLGIKLKIK